MVVSEARVEADTKFAHNFLLLVFIKLGVHDFLSRSLRNLPMAVLTRGTLLERLLHYSSYFTLLCPHIVGRHTLGCCKIF